MAKKNLGQSAATPAALGYRLPAEWELHAATWLVWPHNLDDWPRRFAPIPWVYAEMVRKIAAGEQVRVLVVSRRHEDQARAVLNATGVDLERVEFLRLPTNRSWARDYGPLFIRRETPAASPPNAPFALSSGAPDAAALLREKPRPGPGEARGLAIANFRFNGWAKYPDWQKDDAASARIARLLKVRLITPKVRGQEVVLEGGSIDGNGQGALLATEECLLDTQVQPRNPGLARADLERVFADYLGVRQVLWLARGIAGDDTHGHVDDVCRFVRSNTVVLCQESNPRDENYRILRENGERLEGARLASGERLEIVALPMPEPLYFRGRRLPASYANFYIANAAVLVPTFNDPTDRVALGILGEVFRDRPVVGIHAVDLVWGLGTLHCLTQQQPAAV